MVLVCLPSRWYLYVLKQDQRDQGLGIFGGINCTLLIAVNAQVIINVPNRVFDIYKRVLWVHRAKWQLPLRSDVSSFVCSRLFFPSVQVAFSGSFPRHEWDGGRARDPARCQLWKNKWMNVSFSMSGVDLSRRPGVCDTELPSWPGRHILASIQPRHTPFLEECRDRGNKNKCSRNVELLNGCSAARVGARYHYKTSSACTLTFRRRIEAPISNSSGAEK